MAVRDIKTTIKLDGEKAFEAELRAISKEMRVTNSELKVLRSGFDTTDNAMGNLTRQSELVKEKIEQQKIVIAALEREVRDAARAHGDASEEVQGLTLKLNSAKVAMNSMVKESQQVDREIEELGRDSQKAGHQIRNGIGDAAEDASRDLRSMYDSFAGQLGNIKNMLGLDLAMDFAGGVVDLVQGVNGFAESSRDFNRQMSFLENNARQAGLDLDFVKDKFIEVASVTGETDGAVEGLSNLLQTGFDETEMEKAIDGLKGAVTQFPDTLKFESLADGLQETLATGSATGQYAELLERRGVNLEEFNAALGAAETAEGKQQVALAYLTGSLTDAGKEYEAMNQGLIDAEASSLRLETAVSSLGKTFDTWLTPGRNEMAQWLTHLNENLGLVTKEIQNESPWYKVTGSGLYAVMESLGMPGLADVEKVKSGEVKGLGDYIKSLLGKNIEKEAKPIANDLKSVAGTAIDEGWMTAVDTASDAEDYVKAVTEAMTKYTPDLEGAGSDAGDALGASIATGLANETDLVVAEISATVDQINAELGRVNPVNLSVNTDLGGGGATTGGNINVSLAMDGRTVGKVVAPYVMQTAGRMANTINTMTEK